MTWDRERWDAAQRYELPWHARYHREKTPIGEGVIHDFFQNDPEIYRYFVSSLMSKLSLEIGPGIWPHGLDWPVRQMILVEPLWDKYPPEMKPDLPHLAFVYSQPGEEVLSQYAGAIDGVLVCRNCCDHAADPMRLFTMFLDCAAPGCTLLYWGDYLYLEPPDEGHQSWASSDDELRQIVIAKGFDILYEVRCRLDPAPHTRDWGCVAVKR